MTSIVDKNALHVKGYNFTYHKWKRSSMHRRKIHSGDLGSESHTVKLSHRFICPWSINQYEYLKNDLINS